MKKKIVFSFILGILISSVAYAAVSLSSDKISYKDTTVYAALDNLFDESVNGKIKIAEAITNKGIETLDTDSYDTIVSNINNISTGNPNLRYDEENGYIQAVDKNGEWTNIYETDSVPITPNYGSQELIPIMTSNTSSIGSIFYTSSLECCGHHYYQAFDNNFYSSFASGSDWCPDAYNNNGYPQYIGYEFNNLVYAESLRIRFSWTAGQSYVYFIQYSTDGLNYNTVDSINMTGGTIYDKVYTIHKKVKSIRLYIADGTSATAGGEQYGTSVYAFQVYGSYEIN